MWRRVSVVPFTQRFDGANVNRNLKDELVEELPGIFNWALEGYYKYKTVGLNEPETILNANEEYQKESDQITRFINDVVEIKDIPARESAKAATVYTAYRQWSTENGERHMGSNNFFRALKEKGHVREGSGNNMYFPGMDIRMKVGSMFNTFNEAL